MNRENISRNNLCIAKIVGVHGVKGLLKIKPYTTNPTDIASYGKISNITGSKEFNIEIKYIQKNLVIASIKDINDRNEASSLVGLELYVSRDALPALNEEDFYMHDLLNLNVVDEKDNAIGVVKNIHNFGGGDLLEIEFKVDKKVKSYSFTKENFPEVDIKNKTIKINLF